MPAKGTADLHDALAEFARRMVGYHGQRVEYAVVQQVTPRLVVELTEGHEALQEDDHLVLPRELRQEARDLDVDDTVAVTLMNDGRYMVTNLISDTDAAERISTSGLAAALAPVTARLDALEALAPRVVSASAVSSISLGAVSGSAVRITLLGSTAGTTTNTFIRLKPNGLSSMTTSAVADRGYTGASPTYPPTEDAAFGGALASSAGIAICGTDWGVAANTVWASGVLSLPTGRVRGWLGQYANLDAVSDGNRHLELSIHSLWADTTTVVNTLTLSIDAGTFTGKVLVEPLP